MEFTHTEKVLTEYGERVKKSYQDNLDNYGKVASGSLKNNISVVVDKGERNYEVALNLNHYWKWLEGGRPPTQNDGNGELRRAILEWIRVKPILPEPFNGKLPTESQLSYLISRKIHTLGYEGKPMLEDAVNENDEFLMNLQLALLEDVAIDVEKVLVLFA